MKPKIKALLVLVFFFAIILIQGFYYISHLSYTVNEPIYIMDGYYYLTQGNVFQSGHPIFTHILAALPLLLTHVDVPDPATIEHPYWYARTEWLYYGDNNSDQIMFLARMPFLLLSLLVAYYLFRWTKELYGLWAGAGALLLYTFFPAIIWNSVLTMTDFAVAGFMFISCYFLWKYLKQEKKKWLYLCGLFFGFAITSKSTALFILPTYAGMFLLYKGWSQKKEMLRDAARILLCGVCIFALINIRDINPVYDMNNPFYAISGTRSEERLIGIAQNVTENKILQQVLIFGATKIPLPGTSSIQAYAAQVLHANGGQGQYFLGEFTLHGVWYYFTVLYAIKTPLALLILFVCALLFFKRFRAKDWRDELIMLIPMVTIFFIFSFVVRLNIGGPRHTLLIPLFGILFTAKIFQWKKYSQKIIPMLALLVLLAWYVWTPISTVATSACPIVDYYNELIPEKEGYKYMSDSDLGEDLKCLETYVQEKNIANLYLKYAGFEKPEEINFTVPTCEPEEGIWAVSAQPLTGNFWTERNNKINQSCYAWLREKEPLTVVGTTIYIYNVTAEDTES